MAKAPSAGRSSGNVVRALTRSPMADHHLIVFATVILTAIGEMMVLSSSSVLALVQGESPYYYMIRQLIFLVVGLLLMIPVSRMKPETLRKLAAPAWAAAVLGLVLVQTPLGYETNGNRNWIRIGGLLTIQPSEFAKLVLVLWAAALFHNKRRRLKEPAQLLLPFILGQFSRPWTADFMARNRKNLRWLDQGVICLVVYGAFGDLRRNGITATGTELLIMLALCLVILAFMLCFTRQLARTLGFGRSDEIAIVFCGTKKSLATGVPMATVLFAGQAVGLIVFPLMVFHTLQLIACTIIAQRYAATDSVTNRSQDNNS